MKQILQLLLGVLLLGSCNVRTFKALEKTHFTKPAILANHFVGFALYDPTTERYLIDKNADMFFTPASNVKLFTLYAGYKLLNDSLPGIMYRVSGDSLIFRGTGDPTFLHKNFPYQPVFEFLTHSKLNLYLSTGFYDSTAIYGEGWAWDDYNYAFQPELSEFPIYGNVVGFFRDSTSGEFCSYPQVDSFKWSIDDHLPNRASRDLNKNHYYLNPRRWQSRKDTSYLPIKYSYELLKTLLEDTLNKEVTLLRQYDQPLTQSIKTTPIKEAFMPVMQQSDNFFAEQILMSASLALNDTMRVDNVIEYMLNQYLSSFQEPPIWVDGSGLSRYNLFTPRHMVEIIRLLKAELTEDELKQLLPKGGESGTLKHWFKANKPYVFAKTGTLSNVYCLSGLIEVKSGKTLVFSFLNNNYTTSSSNVKGEMEKVLLWVKDNY